MPCCVQRPGNGDLRRDRLRPPADTIASSTRPAWKSRVPSLPPRQPPRRACSAGSPAAPEATTAVRTPQSSRRASERRRRRPPSRRRRPCACTPDVSTTAVSGLDRPSPRWHLEARRHRAAPRQARSGRASRTISGGAPVRGLEDGAAEAGEERRSLLPRRGRRVGDEGELPGARADEPDGGVVPAGRAGRLPKSPTGGPPCSGSPVCSRR
jgi:hypothetical protein